MKFHCPHCSAKIDADEHWYGLATRCPVCDEVFTVPKPDDDQNEGSKDIPESGEAEIKAEPPDAAELTRPEPKKPAPEPAKAEAKENKTETGPEKPAKASEAAGELWMSPKSLLPPRPPPPPPPAAPPPSGAFIDRRPVTKTGMDLGQVVMLILVLAATAYGYLMFRNNESPQQTWQRLMGGPRSTAQPSPVAPAPAAAPALSSPPPAAPPAPSTGRAPVAPPAGAPAPAAGLPQARAPSAGAPGEDAIPFLIEHPDLWPKEVMLLTPTHFDLLENGAVNGKIDAPAGSRASVSTIERDFIDVNLGAASKRLPIASTDLAARAADVMKVYYARQQALAGVEAARRAAAAAESASTAQSLLPQSGTEEQARRSESEVYSATPAPRAPGYFGSPTMLRAAPPPELVSADAYYTIKKRGARKYLATVASGTTYNLTLSGDGSSEDALWRFEGAHAGGPYVLVNKAAGKLINSGSEGLFMDVYNPQNAKGTVRFQLAIRPDTGIAIFAEDLGKYLGVSADQSIELLELGGEGYAEWDLEKQEAPPARSNVPTGGD